MKEIKTEQTREAFDPSYSLKLKQVKPLWVLFYIGGKLTSFSYPANSQ